jgi:hypothetical protein
MDAGGTIGPGAGGGDAGGKDGAPNDAAMPMDAPPPSDASGLDASPPDASGPSEPHCFDLPGPPMAYVDVAGMQFCIDQKEVTQAQYAAFLASAAKPVIGCVSATAFLPFTNSSDPSVKNCGLTTFAPAALPNRPVVCIDLCSATAYCAWAGKTLCTDSQWLVACTNGITIRLYPYGIGYQPTTCNTADYWTGQPQTPSTLDVGTASACVVAGNESIHDMSGNAWEWGNFTNCPGGQCSPRGGSYLSKFSIQDQCSGTFQDGEMPPPTASGDIGFRCCANSR